MNSSSENVFDDDRETVMRALGDSFPSASAELPPQNFAPKDDLIRRFIRAAEENAATTKCISEDDAIPAAAAEYLRARELPPEIICTPEWKNLQWRAAGIRAVCRAPADADICGISGVPAAAADCGAMSADGEESHRLTVGLLPPHHIAVVRATAIFPSLADIVAAPQGVFSLFCGPSRTADIEQTLTLGVHGPLSVHILIVGEVRRT